MFGSFCRISRVRVNTKVGSENVGEVEDELGFFSSRNVEL